MILCVGEILVDLFGSYKDGAFVYERNAGGAPFNVACAVKQFGGSSAFVGNVGNDTLGKFLTEFAASRELDGCLIGSDEHRNTTAAFVEIDERGERSFCFYRKNTADSYLPCVPDELLFAANTVHIGSLMLSEEHGLRYAEELCERAHAANKLVSFDVNFRTDIFRDGNHAVTDYKKLIGRADIVKLSEDEVEIFSDAYLAGLKDKLVCVSLGASGSKWLYGGEAHDVPTISVNAVDTTGAGDAFYAGVLTVLDRKNKTEWSGEILDKALRFGNICGALNTRGKGAIAGLPTLSEIEKYYP